MKAWVYDYGDDGRKVLVDDGEARMTYQVTGSKVLAAQDGAGWKEAETDAELFAVANINAEPHQWIEA